MKLSANQRIDMWGRWKAGQSLHEIGRALGKDHVVIQFLLARHGGIVPATRRRSLATLALGERKHISRGVASGHNTYIALVWLRLGNLVHVRNRVGPDGRRLLSPSDRC